MILATESDNDMFTAARWIVALILLADQGRKQPVILVGFILSLPPSVRTKSDVVLMMLERFHIYPYD